MTVPSQERNNVEFPNIEKAPLIFGLLSRLQFVKIVKPIKKHNNLNFILIFLAETKNDFVGLKLLSI
jgi:hypothetical protein